MIFEDVIGCTDSEFKIIQQTLSYAVHHRSVDPAILICHSILKNRIHAVLGYVNFVYFTLSPSNATSIAAALRYFRFDRSEQDAMIKSFLAEKREHYGYYLLTWRRGRSRGTSPEGLGARRARRGRRSPW